MFIKNLGYKNTDFIQKFLFKIQKKWNEVYNKNAQDNITVALDIFINLH